MIPVVLIHWGQSERYPLQQIMEHDAKFGNTVHLLNDQKGWGWPITDYLGMATKFHKSYVHLSTNHEEFERKCILRWYALAEWMGHQDLDAVLYTDSDVLLYCNATEQYEEWGKGYSLTLALGSSPATSYITLNGLLAFLDFVDSIYIGRNQYFAEFERIFKEMRAQDLPGGVSDMLCFKFFREEVRHHRVGEMTEIRNGATWDHNINSGDGYLVKDGIKFMHWRTDDPQKLPHAWHMETGQHIRFNSLHFQGGGGKKLLREYLR